MSTASRINKTEKAAPGGEAGGSGALIPMRFDRLCKRVFGIKRMMLDWSVWLLTSESWALLDWSTLTEISPDLVSERNVNRRSDLVWSVRTADGKASCYFLVEFQSRVERSMALRMIQAVAMILGKAWPDNRNLPDVVPLVVYTGPGRWKAPRSLDDLYANVLPEAHGERARLRYRVVELLRYRGRGLRGEGNFASSLFRMLAAKKVEDWERELLAMRSMATDRETRRLADAITELCLALLEMRDLPELSARLACGTITLEGVSKKMQEISWREPILEQGREQGREQGLERGLEQGREQGLEQGREQGLEQGREQGLEQGREQGLEQGRKQLLARQAEARFGKEHARTLSKLLRSVESVGRLDEVGLWLVECDSFNALRKRLEAA